MKKVYIHLLLYIIITLISCGEKEEKEDNFPVRVSGIRFVSHCSELTLGDSISFSVIVEPKQSANLDVKWSSSDTTIAKFKNNLSTGTSELGECWNRLKAVRAGTAIITATTVDGGFSDTCSVKVISFIEEGDYYYSDGSNSAIYNKNKKCLGVIFHKDTKNRTCKVIALDEPNRMELGSYAEFDPSLKSSKTDGSVNLEMIKKFPDYKNIFPGFAYCVNKGQGWYVPASSELRYLYAKTNGVEWDGGSNYVMPKDPLPFREAFDKKLMTAGGMPIYENIQWERDQFIFWSSTWSFNSVTEVIDMWDTPRDFRTRSMYNNKLRLRAVLAFKF